MFSSITNNIANTKVEFSSLTEHIKQENKKQINSSQETNRYIINNFERNQKELELISNHFKNLAEQIPKSLQISLEQLNRGLTSLTTQFQKDYKDIIDNYKQGIQ
jgi:archaellum component FlaC